MAISNLNYIKDRIMDSIKIEGIEVNDNNLNIKDYETDESGNLTSVSFTIDSEEESAYKIIYYQP